MHYEKVCDGSAAYPETLCKGCLKCALIQTQKEVREQSRKWYPIETAPMDQYIQVYEPKIPPHVMSAICDISGCSFGWVNGTVLSCNPTHWMPLPEPPENSGETA